MTACYHAFFSVENSVDFPGELQNHVIPVSDVNTTSGMNARGEHSSCPGILPALAALARQADHSFRIDSPIHYIVPWYLNHATTRFKNDRRDPCS